MSQSKSDAETNDLDDELLEAIDRAEGQIERGEVHDWLDVRERIRGQFLGAKSSTLPEDDNAD